MPAAQLFRGKLLIAARGEIYISLATVWRKSYGNSGGFDWPKDFVNLGPN